MIMDSRSMDEALEFNGAWNMVKALTQREQKVLEQRFIHDKTLDEVGQEMGVNRERVRQIEKKAIRKMRHPSRFPDFQLNRHL